MNILVVTQYFWPENFRINDLVLGLQERGHVVTVFTGLPNYPTGKYFEGYSLFKKWKDDYHGVKVLRVPLICRGSGKSIRLFLNYLSFAISASIIGPFVCKGKYDIIFVFEPSPITVGIPALILKKTSSSQIIFWVQDLWPESLSATGAVTSKWILNIIEKLVRLIYNRCDEILVTSQAYLPFIEKFDIDTKKIKYFPQSVEKVYRIVTVKPDAPQRQLIKNGFHIVFAGNIGSAQDFPTILRAAQLTSKHTDIHWTIIGDGRMYEWVKNEMFKRGLSSTVHLLGRHTLESMPYFFALADVMLVTLKRNPIFSLTIPGKIQSYLACGRPVIAALDGEGARLIEDSGAGISCAAEDPEALSQAVMRMYDMPKAQREEMGRKGRAYYEIHFDRDLLINKLDNWMKKLVNNNQ